MSAIGFAEDQMAVALERALRVPLTDRVAQRAWIKPEDYLPAEDEPVAVLHTDWGPPRPAIATCNQFPDGIEWYSGGMALHQVVGWLPLGPLELPS